MTGEGGVVHLLEQGFEAGGLFVEAIGGDAPGDGVAGVGSAGGDDVDLGVEPADDGEELEAGHAGHIEIGEEDVGHGGPNDAEGGRSRLPAERTLKPRPARIWVRSRRVSASSSTTRRLRWVFDIRNSFLSGEEGNVPPRCHEARDLSDQKRTGATCSVC